MTRINVVPVEELCDQHLMAEWRELTRIPNSLGKWTLKEDEVLEEYRLGAGHMKFFAHRMGWLHQRYQQLIAEGRKRGFKVTDYWPYAIAPFPPGQRDYTPSRIDLRRNRERLSERWPAAARYFGNPYENPYRNCPDLVRECPDGVVDCFDCWGQWCWRQRS